MPTETIDIIVKSPHTGGYDLVLCDDGDPDEVQRYNRVTDRLMRYLEYVHSGQFVEQYPDVKGVEVRCCVVCTRPPNEAMMRIEGIRDRDNPEIRLPVVVMTQDEYLIKKPTEKNRGGNLGSE